MQDTISSIINVTTNNVKLPPQFKSVTAADIIDMYNDILSEEHHDTNDICTMIYSRMISDVDRRTMGLQQACVMIYDIFDICKEHVRNVNKEYDRAKFAEAAQKSYEKDGKKIQAHWAAVTSPR